jgi:DNA topoisomerase I
MALGQGALLYRITARARSYRHPLSRRCVFLATATAPPRSSALVIVESPAKAATIQRMLPADAYTVRSCVGHVREIPSSAKRIPAKYKNEPWSRLGVDIADGFRPLYVLIEGKKKIITELKAALRDADELILATDEDREGEAISWHLVEVLKPAVPIRRAVFHEITPEAINEGLSACRDIDIKLVEAQETRRILDRLAGYTMSPLIWKKIAYGLSAGRVQSVALSLIVQRELERLRFVPALYSDAVGSFTVENSPPIVANLISVGGFRVARGSDFDSETGKLMEPGISGSGFKKKAVSKQVAVLNRVDVDTLLSAIRSSVVRDVHKSRVKRRPPQPFITSTLQQECGNRLGMSAGRTMRIAQSLYENGHITYMRTDNPTLSEQGIIAARNAVVTMYGEECLWDAEEAKRNIKKPKSAQAAHEAIRPAGLNFCSPEKMKLEDRDEQVVYDLIYRRTLASQMALAQFDTTSIDIDVYFDPEKLVVGCGKDRVSVATAGFRATGRIVVFPGFLRAYDELQDDTLPENPSAEVAPVPRILPDVESGDDLAFSAGNAIEHTTKPPPRYTDASLVKELEARGVGRPSTYASIIDKLVDRTYVFRGKALGEARSNIASRALVPSLTAFAVDRLLSTHFPSFVDPGFTSQMEEALDSIAAGDAEGKKYLAEYYLGEHGLASVVERNERDIDNFAFRKILLPNLPGASKADRKLVRPSKSKPVVFTQGVDDSDGEIVPDVDSNDWENIDILVGPHGPYIAQHGKVVVSLPRTILADELTADRLREFIELGNDPVLGTCPESGTVITVKSSKYGTYVQYGRDEDVPAGEKPRRQGLLPGMDVGELTLETALQLLSLPRILGMHPETGLEIRAGSGPFGAYILHEGQQPKYVNIKQEELFSIQLQSALDRLSDAASRRERRDAARVAKKKAATVQRVGDKDTSVASSRQLRPRTQASKKRVATPVSQSSARDKLVVEAKTASNPVTETASRQSLSLSVEEPSLLSDTTTVTASSRKSRLCSSPTILASDDS